MSHAQVLAVVSLADKRLEYYDSLPSGGFERGVFAVLRRWLVDHGLCTAGDIWSEHVPAALPGQRNWLDCGVFVLLYARCVERAIPLRGVFDWRHVPQARYAALCELVERCGVVELGEHMQLLSSRLRIPWRVTG
jgi:Ulp1 family protease